MSGSQVYNGMTFRDEKELARYMELEKLSKQGLISDLYRNVKKEGGKRIAEDARKNEERSTELYKLKKALFLANYPEFIFREI